MTRFLLALLLIAAPSWAAISSSMIFEVRQGGANTNSGCFKEGATGTDFSQSATQSYGFSDLVIDATTNTKVTSASHNFVAADVGNCLRTSSGTGFTTGVFEIMSVASNAATLDRSAGTLGSTGGVFHVGGALATLAQLNTDMCPGCRAYVKADATYTVTTKTTFNFTNSNEAWVAGYTTTRGDGGSFTIQATASIGDRIIDLNTSGGFRLSNVIVDGNSQANTGCLWFIGVNQIAYNLACKNVAYSTPLQLNNARDECRRCWVDGGSPTTAGIGLANDDDMCLYCTVSTNSTSSSNGAFNMARGRCFYCTVFGLTGANSDGFQTGNGALVEIDHCVVYNVTRDAVRVTAVSVPVSITNCVFSTAVNGINNSSGTTLRAGDILNDYNFTYNVSGSVVSGLTAGSHSSTLTKDPFISASTHDFRLNNTNGGGAAVRAKGAPTSLPGLLGTFYPDAGVAQHQDPKFFGVF